MSSAFERLQKIAEERRLKEQAAKPRLEIVPVMTSDQPSAPSAVKQNTAAAPEKDFTKVANSIVRQIPHGVFVGKSKQMYDYLYSLTRGAVKPTRFIRISKAALMRGSGIKSTHTFYNNLRHLETIGLLVTTRIDGEKNGNSYEVFLPEESSNNLVQSVQLEQLTQLAQKLPVAVSAVSALAALGSEPINIGTSEAPKTFFKDNTDDDDFSARDAAHDAHDARDTREAFSAMVERLAAAVKKLTGKPASKREAEIWASLADLLILELEVAARRTDGISSVPAFLTEMLRRQFFATRQDSIKLPKPKLDVVGKNKSGSYEIKPLDAKGRSDALTQLREFATDDFLPDFEKWYTAADWKWLMKNLRASDKKSAP